MNTARAPASPAADCGTGPAPAPSEVVRAKSGRRTGFADPNSMPRSCVREQDTKRLPRTERAGVFLCSARGHRGWEAVTTDRVGPGIELLVPGPGCFSDSGARQLAAFGGVALSTAWGEAPLIDPAVALALVDDCDG